jgi:HSP20 family protein
MNGELQTAPIRFVRIESEDVEFYVPNQNKWHQNFKPHAWSPSTDLLETVDQLIIRIEIAGMNQSEFSIRIEPRRVIVSGYRIETHEPGCYHRMEIPSGDFESEIDLPQAVNPDLAKADYMDGYLTVTLPKVTSA